MSGVPRRRPSPVRHSYALHACGASASRFPAMATQSFTDFFSLPASPLSVASLRDQPFLSSRRNTLSPSTCPSRTFVSFFPPPFSARPISASVSVHRTRSGLVPSPSVPVTPSVPSRLSRPLCPPTGPCAAHLFANVFAHTRVRRSVLSAVHIGRPRARARPFLYPPYQQSSPPPHGRIKVVRLETRRVYKERL